MDKTKKFIRQNEDVVLLVCDFYETRQIPMEMTTKKNNLAQFPVANIPLIEYILASLFEQSLKNVIITGKNIESVEEVVRALNVFLFMNIEFLEVDGNNLGDVFRSMKDHDVDIKDMLVLYANHYTNQDLKFILRQHRLNNFLMTLFLHRGNSNSKINHFYGTREGEVVFYEKCINGKYNLQHIKDTLEMFKTVNFQFNLSSPTIGVISGDVLSIFGDNFDYTSLGDLLEGLFAFNPFNHKIGVVDESFVDNSQDDVVDSLGRINLNQRRRCYSREIITLFDYFRFNEDVKEGSFVNISDYPRWVDGVLKKLSFFEGNYFYDLPNGYGDESFLYPNSRRKVKNTVLGTKNTLTKDYKVDDCFVGDGCTISGNISKCIVWDDIDINQDLNGYIVFSKDSKIPFTHLEIEIEVEEESSVSSNFFDDLVGYLKQCLDLACSGRIQIEEVVKQVNMLRIIWNASDLDLIEAFSVFLTDIVSPEDVEDSAINGSFFFPVLENTVNTIKKQQELLVFIYNQMKGKDLEFKKRVFCIYAYQLFEDGIISRAVYKEYNILVHKNLL